MADAARAADVSGDAGVRAAQSARDGAQQVYIDLGIEAGLLVASTNPVGGQIADGISLASNLAGGNYGAALVDGLGFIPFGGDALKGLIRGNSIRRRMVQADRVLSAARTALSRAQTFARRRIASSQYWQGIKRRRDQVLDRFGTCNTQACRQARDAEMGRVSRLPDPNTGTWRNADGTPGVAGDGLFVPNDGTRLHTALSAHPNGSQGIPFSNGQPDLSAFPPSGSAAPGGGPFSVEIEQSLAGDRTADRAASWGQWRADNPGRPDPQGGIWHHTGDGVTMQYVDQDIHGALAHQGGVAMNTSQEF
ncbi:MAG: HNH endonuclease [Pseudomonadota bacterium]